VSRASKKIALVGFDRLVHAQFTAAGLDVCAHVFANRKNKNTSSCVNKTCMNFHHWKNYSWPEPQPVAGQDALFERVKSACFEEFVRCTDRWAWSRELVHDWTDYHHLFQRACRHAWHWLETHDPTVVVYSNVPHQGVAIVQYYLARETGRQTLVFMQSPFAGKCWLLEHWHDLGSFETARSGKLFDVDVSEPAQSPFYMKSVRGDFERKSRAIGHRLRARTLIGLGLTGIGERTRRLNFGRNIGRWVRAVENNRYYRQSGTVFNQRPALDDLKEPYVYFPLHLQPEMTTDMLGGAYVDQALALEKLRALVPQDIPIYVKENPKQTGHMRSESFFGRISAIPNTRLIARDVSSFELTGNALAVATVTGTAGWEALRLGKPALVFGHAFWNRLPGAFRISDTLRWKQITSFKFSRRNLEKAAAKLSRYAFAGISDPSYASEMKDYDESQNASQLAMAVKYQLEKPHG